MNKKKWFPLFVLLLLTFTTIVSACSNHSTQSESDNSSNAGTEQSSPSSSPTDSPAKELVKLNFSTNASGGTLDAYQVIVDQFNKDNPEINVEMSALGKDFNTLMTAKMANNDLPDLFSTAGWSVRRFGEYLLPLNDRSWAMQVNEQIKPTVTDGNGNLVVLPLDIDISGVVYNPEILKQLNLKAPETWDQFLTACETIKKAGYTPISVAGKDSGDIAGLMSRLSLSLLVQSNPSYKDDFDKDSFDWTHFASVTDFVSNLKKKGYLNVDVLTADKPTVYAELAKGKVAFAFQSNQTIAEVKKLNPDALISMMPLPVSDANTQPFLISGERDSVGIWKESKHPKEALIFLDYLAKSENVQKVAESYSLQAGLKGVQTNLGALQETFDQYSQAVVSNHFDRQYLPNGMFTTLGTVGSGLLSGTMDSKQVEATMKDDYDRLKKAGN
ncbi:ABC transporter substrate-binding protein [Cohnella lupini]|uniref:Carbohydrate ABC transporter substrate-binding protein (CUT1 family) n=1 Tax=Cohnella lupini TaxID=1294267 RepID=A0A3D9I2F3_9BACL|nr:extracellular solute-binding protein [Cohnella lupini]RED55957.1 carbohydrate ABC transporter substrate-binding protein (CUT1 family) [Cohnella lupini]